jgi:glycosyltransferase involved in cell wall biosynthesis
MRNLGMKAARYDRIVFLDDDCILAPDWYQHFDAGPEQYDLLTMKMQLPDGSRYWDHVMTAGPGKQKMLLDHETDPLVYATSGAMAIKAHVADNVLWDERMDVHEDVDFSRRCQAYGFTITHNPNCLAYHADPTYTSIGRWTVRRRAGRTHRWVQTALADRSAVEIYAEGEARLGRDQTAEAADCFRYGALRYPAETLFPFALAGIEQSSGGYLPGVIWYPHGDPHLSAALSAYGADTPMLEDLGLFEEAGAQELEIGTRVDWEAWAGKSRLLGRTGALPVRLDPSDHITEAPTLLLALETAGLQPAARTALLGKALRRMPVALEARLQAAQQRNPPPGGAHIQSLFPPYYQRREGAAYHIGRAMFDVDGLPREWVEACNKMDAIWVPGEFNRRSFARAGVDPSKLGVVPTPLHLDRYDPQVPPLPIDGARGFNFLAILDWKRSKGWETLLGAYLREFTASDDVALVLRPHSTQGLKTPQITQAVIGYVQQVLQGHTALMPTILLHDAEVAEENLPNLYRGVDCFVSASHGEGCGRVFVEAMAMGLPVIGPNWGACRDFMTARNSYLIDCREGLVSEMAARETPLFRGCGWGEPDLNHLKTLMRRVYTRREEAAEVGARARADIATSFGHERVAEVLQREMARLVNSSDTQAPVTVGGNATTEPMLRMLSVTAEVLLG